MYGRTLADRELTLEPSGGLIHGTLVLQDRETDSYWPIMAGRSVAGPLTGTALPELAVARKRTWASWRAQHPDTLVLSVAGREDAPPAYDSYFESDDGFRGLAARDRRLTTKAPIFAFRLDGTPFAAAHDRIIGGRTLQAGDRRVFLYRDAQASVFDSTAAFLLRDAGDCPFDRGTQSFPDGCAEALPGFDTYWYSWSLNNRETVLLGRR